MSHVLYQGNVKEEERWRYEGYRPGTYVRVVLNGVPKEFVDRFNPVNPMILGGLNVHENNLGLLRVRDVIV